VFRNAFFGWKLGGALALAAAMTAYSGWRGESILPPAGKALAQPDRWHGEVLRVDGPVLSRSEEEFTVLWQEVPLRVRGASPSAPGEPVEAVGTLDRDGPRLLLRAARRPPPRAKLRWIWEGISIAVLALILANFLRHFAYRPEAARVRRA